MKRFKLPTISKTKDRVLHVIGFVISTLCLTLPIYNRNFFAYFFMHERYLQVKYIKWFITNDEWLVADESDYDDDAHIFLTDKYDTEIDQYYIFHNKDKWWLIQINQEYMNYHFYWQNKDYYEIHSIICKLRAAQKIS